jgi:hypothetical protein
VPADGTRWLEPYIDGNLATRLNALVMEKAAVRFLCFDSDTSRVASAIASQRFRAFSPQMASAENR